ncbi:MAG TPA: lysophospholipid acyltransferase family protein [Candidatus Dormibacteraeota bacterium]
MYAALRALMRLVVRVYLDGLFSMEGVERVAREGGLLVCSNHASTIDPPLLPAVLPRSDTWSMAKSEYFARPGFSRWLFTHYHAFPVVRHSADRQALRRAQQILSGGQALILYPEGTRVESGGLRRAEPGAGFLARTASVPVQPVGLVGTRECFPKGARWPRRVPVTVRFGVPFRIRKRRLDGRRIENQEAADSIMLAIADLLPESLRGAYAEVDAGRREELEDLREPC